MTATNICYNFVGFRYSPPECEEMPEMVKSSKKVSQASRYFIGLVKVRSLRSKAVSVMRHDKCFYFSSPFKNISCLKDF